MFFFITIKNNQSVVVCVKNEKLDDSVYLINCKYGYMLNHTNDSLEYIHTIINSLCKTSNRDILMKLMIKNPNLYSIENPYLFLQYYKRLSLGYSLNTELLSNIIENENLNNSFEIMTKILINRIKNDDYDKKVLFQNRVTPCEFNFNSILSVLSLSLSELIWHLNHCSSMTNIADWEMVESVHPLDRELSDRGRISLINCKSMIIVFDEKSNIGEGSLIFSYDEEFRNVIKSFENTKLKSFSANSNIIYYKFSYDYDDSDSDSDSDSDDDDDKWGYKLFAIGIKNCKELSEKELSSSPSIEWSLWLLNIVLHDSDIIDKLDNETKQVLFSLLIKQLKKSQNNLRITKILFSIIRSKGFNNIVTKSNEINNLAIQAFNNINKNNDNNMNKCLIELYCASRLHSNPICYGELNSHKMSIEKVSSTYSLLFSLCSKKSIHLSDELEYVYNDKEIVNIMNIVNKYKNSNTLELKAAYNQYTNDNGLDNIPPWNIFKMILHSIDLIEKNIIDVLSYVDLSQANVEGSFAYLIQKSKMLMSSIAKKSSLRRFLKNLRNKYVRDSRKSINVDRFKANDEKEKGITNSLHSNCVFNQVFTQLYHYGEKIWFVLGDNRVFQVNFTNEDASDAGGPYRECLNEMVEDLFSEHLDLFIPTSNKKNKYGVYTDCYIPNPNCKGNEHLKMYEFVGRIMGYSLISSSTLPFMFPKCIWKVISGDELRYKDIGDIDQYLYQNLERIRNVENEEDLPKQQAFVFVDENGETINLKPEGNAELKLENRDEHCELIINYYLHRCDIQMKYMLKGFYSIIPKSFFFLCDGNDVEELVCGKQKIDIDYLKEHTRYSGYNHNDKTIKHFWKVMKNFKNKERRKFIRFVWGRSRLPSKEENWSDSFEISRCQSIDRLPVAHTCSFNMELPDYQNYKTLKQNLRTAINYGLGSMLIY